MLRQDQHPLGRIQQHGTRLINISYFRFSEVPHLVKIVIMKNR